MATIDRMQIMGYGARCGCGYGYGYGYGYQTNPR